MPHKPGKKRGIEVGAYAMRIIYPLNLDDCIQHIIQNIDGSGIAVVEKHMIYATRQPKEGEERIVLGNIAAGIDFVTISYKRGLPESDSLGELLGKY